MLELLHSHYPYWCIMVLLVIGLWGMLAKKNLVKKVVGMTVFQNAIILFFVVSAYKRNATVPIKMEGVPVENVANYINPLPHTLMLTAIVVGVATLGVAFSLLILIYRRYGTLDEPSLLESMR